MGKGKKYHVIRMNAGDKTLWVDDGGEIGEMLFTFDKKKLYNLFRDYPHKLSPEEWLTFNKENPFWEEFFKDQNEKYLLNNYDEVQKLKKKD